MSNKKQKDTQNNSRVTEKLPDVRHKNEGRRKKTCSFYILSCWMMDQWLFLLRITSEKISAQSVL